MSRVALYQKYRSSTFDEVVGQEHIVKSLQNAIKKQKISHAYLFCGPRGTGKTTIARILAKSVNCENHEKAPCGECSNCVSANEGTHPDIIEINGANETHVDDIRDIIERANLAPMMGKIKIYIIDEVHQLSSAASSALLKTLEEPPENVIFILATTDPQKLLSTIISRCQRYDFTKIKNSDISAHLQKIGEKENIHIDDKSAELIANLAEGGMRDALSIMDQCAAYTGDQITEEEINKIYGLTTKEEKLGMFKDIASANVEGILTRTRNYQEQGIDISRFVDDLIAIGKDAVAYSYTFKRDLLRKLNEEEAGSLLGDVIRETCMHISEKLLEAKEKYSLSSSALDSFEIAALGIATESSKAEVKPQEEFDHASMTTVTIEEKKEKEKKKTKQPPKEFVESDELDILSLLDTCNKESKVEAENKLKNLDVIQDLDKAKYVELLSETVVGACGKDCILFITKNEALTNMINEKETNKELYFFLKDNLDIDKMPYAITASDFRSCANKYRELMTSGNLPEAKKIKKYKSENIKEETTEDKIIALFGEDNVEIIGD